MDSCDQGKSAETPDALTYERMPDDIAALLDAIIRLVSLVLRHDDFFGRLNVRRAVPGFTIAHRVADGPPDSVATHTHVEAHFVFVTSGRYISSARRSSEERLPLIYNPPGTTHRDRFRDGAGSFFTVSVETEVLHASALARSQPDPIVLTERRSRGLAAALLWAITHDSASPADLESLALELVGCLTPDPHDCGSPATHASWLDRVYEQVQDSSAQPLTVRQLAATAGVHPVFLARAFRQRFRCTPGHLLQLRRLENAAARMLFSRLPLTEVAAACGFTDQSHMTTAFRRVYGMTPARFRSSFIFPRRTISPGARIGR